MVQSRPTIRFLAAWLLLIPLTGGESFGPRPARADPSAPASRAPSPAESAPRSLRTVSILDRECLERAGIHRPERLAYAPDGLLYVLDAGMRRVVALDSGGRALRTVGGYGTDDASLQVPVDLVIDRRGSLLVLDRARDALIAYDREGHFLTARAFEGAAVEEARAPGARLLSDRFGGLWLLAPVSRDMMPLDTHLSPARVARFLAPEDSVRAIRLAAFRPSGELWIYDESAGALRRFSAGGRHIATIPVADSTGAAVPTELAADGSDALYVADAAGQRIRVYDSAGRVVNERALGGAASGWHPTSLALGPEGRVAIADAERDEIQLLQIERGASR
jgi:DNA-binding beta-propeller fold protein YncE